MSRQIEAGKAFVKLGTEGGIAGGLNRAVRSLKGFGTAIGRVAKIGAGFGVAIGGAIAAATVKFAAAGDALDKMSARTGASVEALSELGFAMEQSGSDSATLEKGLFGLSRAYFDLERGGAASKDAFGAIGIALEDLQGLNAEDQLALVADGLAGVEDMAKRGAIAQAIFGRAGRQMLPMLADGSKGMAKLREEARELGLTIGTDQAKAAAALTDTINRIKRALGGLVVQLGAAFGPTLTALLDAITPRIAEIGDWFRDTGVDIFTSAIAGAVDGVAGLVDAWHGLKRVFKTVQIAILEMSATTIEALLKVHAFVRSASRFLSGPTKLTVIDAEGNVLTGEAAEVSSQGQASFFKTLAEELRNEQDKIGNTIKAGRSELGNQLRQFADDIRAGPTAAEEPAAEEPAAAVDHAGRAAARLFRTGSRVAAAGISDLSHGVLGLSRAVADTTGAMAMGLGDIEAVQSSAIGTFSAAAASRLGKAGGVDQKQLDELKKIEAATETVLGIWEKLKDKTLVWSP